VRDHLVDRALSQGYPLRTREVAAGVLRPITITRQRMKKRKARTRTTHDDGTAKLCAAARAERSQSTRASPSMSGKGGGDGQKAGKQQASMYHATYLYARNASKQSMYRHLGTRRSGFSVNAPALAASPRTATMRHPQYWHPLCAIATRPTRRFEPSSLRTKTTVSVMMWWKDGKGTRRHRHLTALLLAARAVETESYIRRDRAL
jgi:hypothetical protein